MYEIRKVKNEEVQEALKLTLDVFMEFEAPDYTPEGIVTFKRDIINNDIFINRCRNGICPMYVALDQGRIVGVVAMRSNKTHISLLFVDKHYQHKGIASFLVKYLIEDQVKENSSLKEITLNASPYGKGFYLHFGFIALQEEQEIEGIRFTPMKYIIKE